MTRHFGVLIPATNTTVEIEFTRLLPVEWQAHYARVMSSRVNRPWDVGVRPWDVGVRYHEGGW